MTTRMTVAAALALLLVVGCHRGDTTPAPAPPAVTVAHPIQEPVTDHLEFTGNTAPTDAVTLVARVEGYLEKIHFTDGAIVRKGVASRTYL